MARYYKKLILFIIPLFLFFINYDVSALEFNSISVRTAYWYDGGDLYDDGFSSNTTRDLPQWFPISSKGSVSLRLFQWRLTTDSPLAIGRYKFSFNVSFSSLSGNDIDNFLTINSFEEYGAGTAYNNSTIDNMTLINYRISRVNDLTFKFEYTFDLINSSCNFFSGIIKWGPNYYDEKYVVNYEGTSNSNLSYSISAVVVEILNNQDIIDNQDKNTQDIIDNNNQNNEELKDTIEDQFKSCTNIDKSYPIFNSNVYLNSSGDLISSQNRGVSDYLSIGGGNYRIIDTSPGSQSSVCFYDDNKKLISCISYSSRLDFTFTSPENSKFLRYSIINSGETRLIGNVCINKIDETNNTLTDDNIDNDVGTGFFDNFNNEDFGLSEIITIPLTTISSLTSKSCQPLSIPIPKTDRNVTLPCMTQVYNENIPSIFSIWQIVSFGIISYFIAIDVFHLVKGFKDPESDKVEVLDL